MPAHPIFSTLQGACPDWLDRPEHRARLEHLPTPSLDALHRLLCAEIESRPSFELRERHLEDLKAFDLDLNHLVAELLTAVMIPGPQTASHLRATQARSDFFDLSGALDAVDGVVRTLDRDGYCASPLPLDSARVAALLDGLGSRAFQTRGPARDRLDGNNLLALVRQGQQPPLDDGDTYWLVDQDALVHDPHFTRLAFDPYLIAVAAAYLGVPPIHVQTHAWFSLPSARFSANLSSNAQMFHQDKEFARFLKVFIYLSDVGEEQGPHRYVEGSHRDELHRMGPGLSDRVADKDITRYYDASRLRTLTGPAGTVVFGDTSCVHKGEPVLRGHRIMLQLEYASSLYLSPVSPFSDFQPGQADGLPWQAADLRRMTANYDSRQREAFIAMEAASDTPPGLKARLKGTAARWLRQVTRPAG